MESKASVRNLRKSWTRLISLSVEHIIERILLEINFLYFLIDGKQSTQDMGTEKGNMNFSVISNPWD